MGLSQSRVQGIRHVVNSTAPNPEEESQGIRADWQAELFGQVSTFEDLPTEGNYQGRKRWIQSPPSEVTWDGQKWVNTVVPNVNYYVARGSSFSIPTGDNWTIRNIDDMIEDVGGITMSNDGTYGMPYPGRYQVTGEIVFANVSSMSTAMYAGVRPLWRSGYNRTSLAAISFTNNQRVVQINDEIEIPPGANPGVQIRKYGSPSATTGQSSWLRFRYLGRL